MLFPHFKARAFYPPAPVNGGSIYRSLLHAMSICFLSLSLSGQGSPSANGLEDFNSTKEKRTSDVLDSNFRFIESELKSALKEKDSAKIASFYVHKGLFYFTTDQNLTLEYFFKAREIFEKLKDSTNLASAYRAMGVLDVLSLAQSRNLLNRALQISKRINDIENVVTIYNNFGVVYTREEMYDSALYYYNRASEIPELQADSVMQAGLCSNLGYIEMSLQNYDQGLKYFYRALHLLPAKKSYQSTVFEASILGNLMRTYTHLGQYDSAFHYFDRIKVFFYLGGDIQATTYGQLSELYNKLNDHEKALLYYQKGDSIQEARLKEQKANSLKLIELEYTSQIKEQQLETLQAKMEKEEYLRLFLFLILALVLIFSIVIVLLQRQKAKRKREADQKLMEISLKNAELQKQYLSNELNYTNKELTSFATNIVENHNILSDLKRKVGEISRENSVKNMREQMQELNLLLQQIFNSAVNRQRFLKRSKQLNYALVFYLKNQYPQLSEGDINILILIFLKFSSKEIAILHNIEAKSVEQRRYRIRHKLNMKTTDSFEVLFDSILMGLRASGVVASHKTQSIPSIK